MRRQRLTERVRRRRLSRRIQHPGGYHKPLNDFVRNQPLDPDDPSLSGAEVLLLLIALGSCGLTVLLPSILRSWHAAVVIVVIMVFGIIAMLTMLAFLLALGTRK